MTLLENKNVQFERRFLLISCTIQSRFKSHKNHPLILKKLSTHVKEN